VAVNHTDKTPMLNSEIVQDENIAEIAALFCNKKSPENLDLKGFLDNFCVRRSK